MKRVGNLWDSFVSLDNGILAVHNGTQNKRTDYVVRRKLGYHDDLPEHKSMLDPAKVKKYAQKLVDALKNDWHPAEMRHLIVKPIYGKKRNIDCPCLADHIIHWMLMQTIHDIVMRGMYEHSYGSIPGRGIDAARKTMEKWVRLDTKAKYFVKLDIRKFYEHIDHDLLKAAFRRVIKDSRMLDVIDKVIDCIPVGVPIGTYTLQWFANFFLQPLDHHIKQDMCKLRRGKRTNWVAHYLRYMDDMLLLGTSKRDLEKAVREVIRYCRDVLRLEVKDCWEIRRIAVDSNDKGSGIAPIDIVGYRFYRDHTEVRGSIFLHTSRLATRIEKRLRERNIVLLRDAEAVVSLVGWFEHADSKRFIDEYIKPRIDIGFMREVISYASKNGIVGETAYLLCHQRQRDGAYQVLRGCSRGAARRRYCFPSDHVGDVLPLHSELEPEDPRPSGTVAGEGQGRHRPGGSSPADGGAENHRDG